MENRNRAKNTGRGGFIRGVFGEEWCQSALWDEVAAVLAGRKLISATVKSTAKDHSKVQLRTFDFSTTINMPRFFDFEEYFFMC